MKTIRIKSDTEVTVGGEKGKVGLILEIPYPESIFTNKDRAEELNECLDRGKEVLRNKGIKVHQKKEIFINIERQAYGPIMQQLVDYLAATLTSGASNVEILSLLQVRLEEIRREAIEIVERNTENAKKWS